MYDQRSNIVHGGNADDPVTAKGERVPFHVFEERVENHLRSTLKEFIKRCKEKSEAEVLQELNEKVIVGGL